MPSKLLDSKLASLSSDDSSRRFVLADAKDADMAFGLTACGEHSRPTDDSLRFRSLQDYENQIREIVSQGLIDIMLMSARTADRLAHAEGLFEHSVVTPAVRMNDSTDIWLAGQHYGYAAEPSLPFSTASIPHVMFGSLQTVTQGKPRVDLGLYSITLNHDAARDRETLETYRRFRHAAEAAGFRHFLEVFPPNAPRHLQPQEYAGFMADSIVRLLAGVVGSEYPRFLKIPFLGRQRTTELCEFDGEIIVGIMGGASGTTHDAFQLLAEARECGARAALFGRKINNAEHQLAFIQHLRWVADGDIKARDAVHSYHAALEQQGIVPKRPLEIDLDLTDASVGIAG